jgi:hypothetical protein
MLFQQIANGMTTNLRKHHFARHWGRLQETLFPSNLDRGEEICFELAVDLLIPRPS